MMLLGSSGCEHRILPFLDRLCMRIFRGLSNLFAKTFGLLVPKLPADFIPYFYRPRPLNNPRFTLLLGGAVVFHCRLLKAPTVLIFNALFVVHLQVLVEGRELSRRLRKTFKARDGRKRDIRRIVQIGVFGSLVFSPIPL